MDGAALIQLALSALGCSQKELASKLHVSAAQISKWKSKEYMSADMEARLRALSGIEDRVPEFVTLAGSLSDAKRWEKLLRFLADDAAESAETGYHTYRLEEEEEANLLYWHTLHVLDEMGVEIPKPFPVALEWDPEVEPEIGEEQELDKRVEALFHDPLVSLIRRIYKSYTDVYGFHAAYVSDLVDELDLYDSSACNIEPDLIRLAASKVEVSSGLAKKISDFQWRTRKDYTEWLTLVKERAFKANMPLRAELLDLVHGTHDSLGHEAEAESLGFNASRLHPDIYMNELLVGMRVIHQVLPAIMSKLGIEKEFELDQSELHLR
jgi:transcriptional regulator with XRE-family HTH domain